MKRNPLVCQGCEHRHKSGAVCLLPIECDDDVTLGMLKTLNSLGFIGSDCPRWLEQVVLNQTTLDDLDIEGNDSTGQEVKNET